MSASFEPRKKESAVDTVVNSIKKLILDKELKPGDKLPTEIEIATGLEVSRGSVREAMKILSAFGLIEVKVGSGTYISDRMNNKMADSFIFSFFATNPDMHHAHIDGVVWHLDVGSSHPGAGEGPKGWVEC